MNKPMKLKLILLAQTIGALQVIGNKKFKENLNVYYFRYRPYLNY